MKMEKLKNKLLLFMITLIFLLSVNVIFAVPQVNVQISEYVNQNVIYNPLNPSEGIWYDNHENETYYNLTGIINVTNENPNGKTISDIYIKFLNTTRITLPFLISGRNGTFIANDTSAGYLVLHIPELQAGQSSVWKYYINLTATRPPLNFTSNYSDTKVLAGSNITVTDKVQNVFDNAPYQSNTCIYGINITQRTEFVNFSGTYYYFYFLPSLTSGPDATNVTYSADNKTQYWHVWNFSCLPLRNFTYISYGVKTPYNIPKTTDYYMINSTLEYKLNSTISQMRVTDIKAISEANISFEKKIWKPSSPTLYGSNVTWNVTGFFSTGTNITYNLSTFTLWVAKRGTIIGNPNTIANDTISGKPLNISYSPYVLVNETAPWMSPSWYFNYSDLPTPIVWAKANFTIANTNSQLVKKSITKNGKDIYIKELYLIVGYWLEIYKNITSLGNNSYHIHIYVHNKGNQVTPGDTVVTVYDFVPQNYNVSGPFVYSASPWYTTSESNYSVVGNYNGTLYQWGLVPTNSLNTSFAEGPTPNENNTWTVDYNVTGLGDYKLMNVFVTGLDPQRVEGAGATKSIVISEIFEKIKSPEGIFASFAGILLLLGILI